MADDAQNRSTGRPDTPRPTGEPPRKPAPGGLPVGARAAILFGVLVLLAVVIVLLATLVGGGGNGQTTGMAAVAWGLAAR